MTTPADIVNRALDAIGRSDMVIGDIEEGTDGAQPALRAYDPALRQLLRAAHWNFARKMVPLVLLADASGQTADVGTQVLPPWVYEYAYPDDCMKARFLPQNYLNPNQASSVPQTSAQESQPPYGVGMRLTPAPFLVSSDFQYPVNQQSNWQEGVGTSPAGRIVVLTNVQQAQLVYTALMPFPSMWDPLFEQALVDLLSVRLSPALAKDDRSGLAKTKAAEERLRQSLTIARAQSANEGSYPQTTDNIPDFIRIRSSGGGLWGTPYGQWNAGQYGGPGYLWSGWDSLALGNGSVY